LLDETLEALYVLLDYLKRYDMLPFMTINTRDLATFFSSTTLPILSLVGSTEGTNSEIQLQDV
jgi:hypothetical protein